MNESRINELEQQIIRHKKLYYEGEPEISDQAYDQIEDELRKLDPDNPVLNIVGYPEGGKVEHDPPMLSAQKATTLEEVTDWAEDINYRSLYAGYKVDGLSLNLRYENGNLKQAATRGNGEAGDDQTLEAMKIEDIPKTIPYTKSLNVQGEVYMKISTFEAINKELHDEDEYASPRNLAAGTIKQKSVDILDERPLNFMAWDLVNFDDEITINEQVDLLDSWGFTVADRILIENPTPKEIENTFQKFVEERDDLDFEIDGVIFKYNRHEDRINAGSTGHHPKWSIAWKFESKGKITKIEDITWQVGRTGVLTPVAELAPIDVSGATISRATLHNVDYIKEHHITIGDEVSVIRSGDVIPKVTEVVVPSGKEIDLPNNCPSCGSELTRDGPELLCTGIKCRDRDIQSIHHWVKVTEIKGLGQKSIEKLYNKNIIRHYADLYDPNLRRADLVDILGKNGSKIFDEIDKTRNLPFQTFLAGLGIRNLGSKLGKDLAKEFDSIEELQKASIDELTQIDGISDLTASYINEGINDKNKVDRLINQNISIDYPQKKSKKGGMMSFFNKDGKVEYVDAKQESIYVTGKVDGFTKSDLKEKLQQRGFEWKKSVSGNLDKLITGKRPGSSKLADAEEKGVEVISWENFNASLDNPIT